MLQNRYGDREFPIRDRWSNARLYRVALQRANPRRAMWRGILLVLPAIVVLVATASGLIQANAALTEDESDRAFLLGLVVFVVLMVLGLLAGQLIDRSKPRREQERYRSMTGAGDITERQQQLLALDAQSDFAIGGWNSSLDYAPAWSMMPAEVRAEHERASKPYFVTMPLLDVRAMRAKLDSDEHIASSNDVELFVADALSDSSLSARFHRILHGPDGERMLARVASLTGTSEWDLRALDEAVGGRPAHLLWAADSQRVVAIVRMAYLAEHIDARSAWRLIERAAAPGTGLFGSWDDYWTNVRIGHAFWSDRLEVVQAFDDSIAGLRASEWPAAHVAFPAGPVPSWLPVFSHDRSSTADDQP